MDEAHIKKILVLVEGAKTDVLLMNKIISSYPILDDYRIVSYCTNIYALYQEMMMAGQEDLEATDILLVLKSREKREENRKLFDEKYTDILLVFDLDPQDSRYDSDVLLALQKHFSDSSDMGKLYLNYPMVEAFYHLKSIPDDDYYHRMTALAELKNKKYKLRVQQETLGSDYRKFAVSRDQMTIVIRQNMAKAHGLQSDERIDWSHDGVTQEIDHLKVLQLQLALLEKEEQLQVLSTCGFFIADYNRSFMEMT
ncbi:hypothetical protein FXB42_12575 [Acetobacterium wieringae]|uniref:RloB domain-containing protein n=1 Tax=Acetobacterium wieringae TaxID=52694 RepID=A0A5D0WJH0_9FIRM|nr:hypothetical protein [Acetobacterium wieringae]TYC84164.1 hypothetical protein FXB42_12575 [Acetobacterium wieringae]